MKSTCMLIAVLVISLSGCLDEDLFSDDTDDVSSQDNVSAPTGTYDYSFSCGLGQTHTVPIPQVGCNSDYEFYAETFGCNDVYNMDTAACNLEACTGEAIFGCGMY